MRPLITCPKCLSVSTVLQGVQRDYHRQKIRCRTCGKYSTIDGRADEYEAWNFPDARYEARECLKIANANGGIPKMRETIAISDGELQQLEKFSVAFPEMRAKIERAIRFRQDVLENFELFAAGTELPLEDILAKPVSAEEHASLVESLQGYAVNPSQRDR